MQPVRPARGEGHPRSVAHSGGHIYDARQCEFLLFVAFYGRHAPARAARAPCSRAPRGLPGALFRDGRAVFYGPGARLRCRDARGRSQKEGSLQRCVLRRREQGSPCDGNPCNTNRGRDFRAQLTEYPSHVAMVRARMAADPWHPLEASTRSRERVGVLHVLADVVASGPTLPRNGSVGRRGAHRAQCRRPRQGQGDSA